MKKVDLVLVGGRGGSNIGESFSRAAKGIGLIFSFLDHRDAQSPSRWRALIYRYCFDRQPQQLATFSEKVLRVCDEHKPKVLITTGLSPVRDEELRKIKGFGTQCVNYLTDDPWSSAHKCAWFSKALKNYDIVFSVRRANMKDISHLQGPKVYYLPFGYDPEIFYPEELSLDLKLSYESEIVFVGGGDVDREPYIQELIRAGLKVKLYGSYWERFKSTRVVTQGQANVETIRQATRAAKIALCLVRRANRDDNCMRSFEIPAIGVCMLTEDTIGHREVFGPEGQAVLYFKTPGEMLERTRFLLKNSSERERLALAANAVILRGKHTYQNRLATMLRESLPHG